MGYQQQEANVRFGREASRLRRLSGFTQERLAREIGGFSSSHISNIESGKRAPNLRMVRDLDRALHADGRLERLWGKLTNDGEPAWLDELSEIERDALCIMEAHTNLFPALLQTERYARVVTQATSPWATRDEIEASIKSRMRRAQRFVSADSPAYRAVIDGSVIYRRWGYNDGMAEQLSHVADQIERGRISIQVVEATRGHPGLAGPFTLISSPAAPDVVYVESAHAGHMIDEPEQVQRYRLLLADIQAVALSPEESLKLVRDALEGLDHE